jgi:hypothetical protein
LSEAAVRRPGNGSGPDAEDDEYDELLASLVARRTRMSGSRFMKLGMPSRGGFLDMRLAA